jgi:hypothetical protein
MTFSIIKNKIDGSIKIIRHDDTGFYNISTILRTNGDVMHVDEKVDEWLNDADMIRFIEECKRYLNDGMAMFVIDNWTPSKFNGVYVHNWLYTRFMRWHSDEYESTLSTLMSDI